MGTQIFFAQEKKKKKEKTTSVIMLNQTKSIQHDADFPIDSLTASEAGLAHPLKISALLHHLPLPVPSTQAHLPSRQKGPSTHPSLLTKPRPATLPGKNHLALFFITFFHALVKWLKQSLSTFKKLFCLRTIQCHFLNLE